MKIKNKNRDSEERLLSNNLKKGSICKYNKAIGQLPYCVSWQTYCVSRYNKEKHEKNDAFQAHFNALFQKTSLFRRPQ